ncbi:MAG: 1-deoxy-D-xylulose-5-phosphate reductoisomerase [Alphaproteobacteria bacterium]|nr:1-deoxy-D-xylulose-5-phosphate reductoisomerase [Alphaproteobacteria bacterium]
MTPRTAARAPRPAERARPKRVSVLGATGSVGGNTLDLLERHAGRYEVEALTANTNVELLASQARKLRARFVAIADPLKWRALKTALSGSGIESAAGGEAVIEAAKREADIVVAAIVGAAGLDPTLAAIESGKAVALANKECLVCAGDLLVERVRAKGGVLLPVDSEHNAIFQVFDFARPESVERIILTASGGPFRDWSVEALARATPAQAVAHPNWSMGAKISVDSATMMNKGLELIEAHHLFGLPEERIEVLIHPQSVVHSLVAYVDGSVLAQLGTPDMRTPIACALAWPDRIPTPSRRLDLAALGSLTFAAPDPARFPALTLAREALVAGGSAPTVLNAANEVAVAAFLEGRIGFLDIAATVERVLAAIPVTRLASLDDVRAADAAARAAAARAIDG